LSCTNANIAPWQARPNDHTGEVLSKNNTNMNAQDHKRSNCVT
jgi:hypothetical protein